MPPTTLAAALRSDPQRPDRRPALDALARRALAVSVGGWCIVAVLGQLMFGAYVLGLYGAAALQGRFEAWNTVTPRGWVAGDAVGNAMVASHLLFTVVVVLGGALQLLPWLRRVAPRVHRWNGRVYGVAALVLALGGLGMMWTRGTVGGLGQHLGTSFNAILIVVFAVLAWREARAGRFASHRRWALRLWVAVAGVWFFRIGLMAWLIVNQAPVGFDPETFSGPFLVFLAFAQTLLPLAVLQLVLHVQDHGRAAGRLAVAGLLSALTLLTALGVGGATLMMWLPRL